MRSKKIDDFTFESLSVRADEPDRESLPSTVRFSEDCMQVSWIKTAGARSYSGNPDLPDIRVYDRLGPFTGAVSDFYFGAWRLNRDFSGSQGLCHDAYLVYERDYQID